MLDDIVKKRTDYQKPRKEGLTYVVDKYQGSNTELWKLASPYVDRVKMQGAIPLLSTETILAKIATENWRQQSRINNTESKC